MSWGRSQRLHPGCCPAWWPCPPRSPVPCHQRAVGAEQLRTPGPSAGGQPQPSPFPSPCCTLVSSGQLIYYPEIHFPLAAESLTSKQLAQVMNFSAAAAEGAVNSFSPGGGTRGGGRWQPLPVASRPAPCVPGGSSSSHTSASWHGPAEQMSPVPLLPTPAQCQRSPQPPRVLFCTGGLCCPRANRAQSPCAGSSPAWS